MPGETRYRTIFLKRFIPCLVSRIQNFTLFLRPSEVLEGLGSQKNLISQNAKMKV